MRKAAKAKSYGKIPKKVFRQLGLGKLDAGNVTVVGGFVPPQWWQPIPVARPIVVQAKILRRRA
jgi:hypothetical protein